MEFKQNSNCFNLDGNRLSYWDFGPQKLCRQGFEGGDKRTAESGRTADRTEPGCVRHMGVHCVGAAWGPGESGATRVNAAAGDAGA